MNKFRLSICVPLDHKELPKEITIKYQLGCICCVNYAEYS